MASKDNTETEQRVSPEQVRDVMRHWATGVAIVASTHDGVQHGMTVSSFTSLALTPPLVLVSLEKDTRTHQLVLAANVFGLSILASDQEAISNRFAGRETEDSDRFEAIETYKLQTGCPLLIEAMAVFDCEVRASYGAGTHTMFVGEVVQARVQRDAERTAPLVYFNRDYRQLKD